MADMRHGLAYLNTQVFVVNGQKHKVLVLVFLLEQAEHFENKIEQNRRNFPFCNKTIYTFSIQETLQFNIIKQLFMPVCV